MSKKTFMAGLIAIIVIIIAVFGYFFASQPQATPKTIPSQYSFYFPDSRIFVVSANASYGNYPFPTVTNLPYSSPSVIAKNGEPCVIINVTLRNDYSYQNPAPYQLNDSGFVYVALSANLYNNETKIDSKDITNAFPLASVFTNRAFTELDYGKSTEVTIYITTNSHSVTSFQLVPAYVGEMPPP